MPYEYNPDEFAAGSTISPLKDTTRPGGYGTLLSSATDGAQAGLYGLGEAVAGNNGLGMALRDSRIENSLDSQRGREDFYRNGDPRTWDEAQGFGGVAKYAAGLAVQSAPYMAASLAGGFVGGVPGAVAVGSLLGTGDVLDSQREQAGETDLLSAVPLGIAYGAADSLLGVGGMAGRAGGALRRKFAGEAAGRIGGTGVSALDDVGMDALNKMTGFTGGLARTGASMAKNAGVEAVTETFQEGMNQLGRMAVDPTESFYNDRSAENFRESAIGGGLLGGMFGGAMGGWRRSPSAKPLDNPNNSVDVLGTPDPEHVGRLVDGEQYRLSGFDTAPKYNQAAPSLETAQSEIAELLSHRSSILSDPRMQDPEFAGQAAPFLATVDKRVEELQTVGNVHGELAQLMNQKNSILREPRMRFPQFAEQAAPFLATVDKRIAELQKQLPAEPEGQMDLFAQPAWEPKQSMGGGQATLPFTEPRSPEGNYAPAQTQTSPAAQQQIAVDAQKLQAQKAAEDTYKSNSATMYGWLHEGEQGPKIPSTLEGSVVKAHRQLLELTDGQEGALGTTLRGSIQALGQPGSDKGVKDAAKAISKAFEAQEKQKAEAQAVAAPAAQVLAPAAKTAEIIPLPNRQAPAAAVKTFQPVRYGDGSRGAVVTFDNGKAVEIYDYDGVWIAGKNDLGTDLESAAIALLALEKTNPSPPARQDILDAMPAAREHAKTFVGKREAQLDAEADAGDRMPIYDLMAKSADEKSAQGTVNNQAAAPTAPAVAPAPVVQEAVSAPKSEAVAPVAPKVHRIANPDIKPASGDDYRARNRSGFTRIKQANSEMRRLDKIISKNSAPVVIDGTLPEEKKAKLHAKDAARLQTLADTRRLKVGLKTEILSKLPTRAELHDFIKPYLDAPPAELDNKRRVEHIERARRLTLLTGMQLDKKTGELRRTVEGPKSQAEVAQTVENLGTGEKGASRQAITNLLDNMTLTEAHIQRIYADVGSELSDAAAGAEGVTESELAGEDVLDEDNSSSDSNADLLRAPEGANSGMRVEGTAAAIAGDEGFGNLTVSSTVGKTGDIGPAAYEKGKKVVKALITSSAQGSENVWGEYVETLRSPQELTAVMHYLTEAATTESTNPADTMRREIAQKILGEAKAKEKSTSAKQEAAKVAAAKAEAEARAKREVEIEAVNKDRALRGRVEAAARLARTQEGQDAVDYWNNSITELEPRFENLPIDAQASWLLEYIDLREDPKSDADTIQKFQESFARSLEPSTPQSVAGDQKTDGGTAREDARSGNKSEDSSGDTGAVESAQVTPEDLKAAEAQWGDLHQGDYGLKWAELSPAQQEKLARTDSMSDTAADMFGDQFDVDYSKSSSNPDQGVNTLPIEAFSGATNARELLNTYLKHATDAALRDLATLFLKIPAIGGVRVTFLKKGDTPGNFITRHFNNGAGALAVTGADGVHLYFRLDDVESFREDTVLHEVLHSLTTAALHRNPELRNELRALAKSISSALGDTAYQSKRGEDANLKNFWSSAVNGSASELLAYGLTSPTFRKLFSQYADDGKPFNDYRPEDGAAVRVNPNRPQSFRLEAPNKPTLFQRVVDFFAKVLGFPQKYKAQFDAATKAYLDKKAANDKAEADYNTMRPLQAKLERALHSLLADTEKRGNALASDTVAEAQMARTPAAPIRGNPAAAALTPGWQGFFDKVKAGGSWALVRGMLTSDLIGAASKVLTSAPKYLDAMNKILVERTKAERDVGVIMTAATKLSNAERGVGAGSVNALLMKSTMSKKWAFVPDWIPKAHGLQADPAMEREFLALSEKAQAVVKQVFKHGYDTTTTLQNEVNKNVASEYDAVIAQLEANGDTEGANREKAKKAKSLRDFQTLLNQRGLWPYAPLRRFGNHVVMAMSKEYLAAKDANDSKLMKELEKDGDHYQVAFAESRSAAVKLRADMEAGNAKFSAANGGYADNFERLSQTDSMMGGRDMLSAFRRLRGMVSDSMEGDGAKARAGIDNAMRQLYLQLLAESSARKGEMNRRNVVGADADMMRAFATNGRSTAHFIANLKTGAGVDDALKRMEKEVKVNTPGREARQRYFNEIMKRHTMGLVYDPSPGVDAALLVSSGYMLLSNPSYFIINGTQPWMMSVPLMGGRFGLGKAASAMAKAYGELAMPALKGKLSGTTDLNVQLIIPADAAPAVADLASRGIISIELSHELGGYESVDGGAVKNTFAAGHALIKNVAQGTETFNRLTTAIAAYRLAKGANMSEKAATEYAASVINDTHGDYNGFNYPRFMRTDLGRIATQFRKFQLIQASLFVRLFNDMSRGATADVKKAALWALLYNIGTLVAVGGAVAAPGFVLGATLVGALFGDDDEPNDPRAWLIKAAGKDMGELIYGGVTQFMGVPLGERLGAGQMLSILPYTDLTLTKDGFNGVLRGLSGPLVGGVIGKVWEGMGLGLSGDPYKGAEMALPTGVANLMKAFRFLGEGVTNRNGDVLIAPDDISGLALLGQAIGMPTSTIKDRMANAASVFESDTFYKNRTSEIKRGYTEAVRAGDTDTTAELREKWSKMQEARARNGYKKQPLSELLKAPQEQLKREARTSGGVQYRDSNQGAVESLTQ